MNSREFGNMGETMACNYLASLGYTILERNWYFGKKELDVIASFEDKLVFVEVKARQDDCLEDPTKAITKAKKKHLLAAANAYILEKDLDMESRFDVITVLLDAHGKPNLTHYESAIIPEL
jgi:putative endonuclease